MRITEAFRDYIPPFDMVAIVERLLSTVPDKYLTSLDSVVLTNETSLSRKDRVGKVWSRGRKFRKTRILGRYHGATRHSPAYIELRADKIASRMNRMVLRIPILRELIVGDTLFHELGHHIHRTIRPEYTEREDVADNWATKLNANFIREKYRYAVPFLLLVGKVLALATCKHSRAHKFPRGR